MVGGGGFSAGSGFPGGTGFPGHGGQSRGGVFPSGEVNLNLPEYSEGDVSYKNEVVALAHENKIFSELIEILDSRETVVKSERYAEEHHTHRSVGKQFKVMSHMFKYDIIMCFLQVHVINTY